MMQPQLPLDVLTAEQWHWHGSIRMKTSRGRFVMLQCNGVFAMISHKAGLGQIHVMQWADAVGIAGQP
jgi:hypothetical protein